MYIKVKHKTLNLNELKYNLSNELVNNLIKEGATIFGEYVRDRYIRERFSSKYWKMCERSEDHITEEEAEEKYWDLNFLPETKLRLLLPKRIQILFNGNLNVLEKYGYNVSYYKYHELNAFTICSKIFPDLFNIDIIPYTISCNDLYNISIFECDAFVMDKNGFRLLKEGDLFETKFEEHKILKQMTKLTTNTINSDLIHNNVKLAEDILNKTEKMEKKGWIINSDRKLLRTTSEKCEKCSKVKENIISYKYYDSYNHVSCI